MHPQFIIENKSTILYDIFMFTNFVEAKWQGITKIQLSFEYWKKKFVIKDEETVQIIFLNDHKMAQKPQI